MPTLFAYPCPYDARDRAAMFKLIESLRGEVGKVTNLWQVFTASVKPQVQLLADLSTVALSFAYRNHPDGAIC